MLNMTNQKIDPYSAFKRFQDHAEFMFKGPLANKEEEAQCNYLMLWIGETGRQIFSTIVWVYYTHRIS